jgi:hypothetical protein
MACQLLQIQTGSNQTSNPIGNKYRASTDVESTASVTATALDKDSLAFPKGITISLTFQSGKKRLAAKWTAKRYTVTKLGTYCQTKATVYQK